MGMVRSWGPGRQDFNACTFGKNPVSFPPKAANIFHAHKICGKPGDRGVKKGKEDQDQPHRHRLGIFQAVGGKPLINHHRSGHGVVGQQTLVQPGIAVKFFRQLKHHQAAAPAGVQIRVRMPPRQPYPHP